MDLLSHVDEKIRYIYEYAPVFHIQNKYDSRLADNYPLYAGDEDNTPLLFYWNNGEKIPATPFSLLPQSEHFGEIYASEMQLKQVCLIAANGDVALSKRFYEETDILEVYDFYVLVSSYTVNKN